MLLRDEECGKIAMNMIENSKCPRDSPAFSPYSTLAKLLSFHASKRICDAERLVHQADLLAFELTSESASPRVTSDWHNGNAKILSICKAT